jgi:hypothetical protein
VTTPIYLGSVSSTRPIKKIVFTGDEDWKRTSADASYDRFQLILDDKKSYSSRTAPMCCTHYTVIDDGRSLDTTPNNSIYCGNGKDIYIKTTQYSDLTTFKTYLQQQYANGTPVTVWYILQTAETAAVNEPLMKIGTYSDSISGISHPTTDGANTITVDTTVQPSEFTATWTGWHNASVKEWDGTNWE